MMAQVRSIKTVYYLGRSVVKINRAAHDNSAVLRCIDHMQLNDYAATSAEVFDENTGTLHAVIRRVMNTNTIVIAFKREVKRGM